MMDPQTQTARPVLVVGVGNEYRGDDGVGLVVARRLRKALDPAVTVLEETGDGLALMAAWKGADLVIVIDAVGSAGQPGAVCRLDARLQSTVAAPSACSTHAISLMEAIQLARALGELPPRLVVYGVQGKSFELGTGLSAEVAKAVPEVTKLVLQEIGRPSPSTGPHLVSG
jgi:hydrogenase maturation protease